MIALPDIPDRPEPLPRDPLGQRLCETFSYFWQAIVGVNEASPGWQTLQKYPLRPRVLWKLWQDAAQLVGVRFANQTRYALIDIDAQSIYHPSQDSTALPTIRAALETIGIYRTLLVRSSWSGGLHLYIPLPEAVPTFALASALRQCLEAQGMAIAPGQLETFPNCKSYALPGTFTEYNAHRLPLQPASGSLLLDADCNPVSSDLQHFFKQWDAAAAAQDMREVREAIATAKSNRRGRRHRQSTVVEEWLQDLRTEMEEGWTGYGQTNHLLKTIACYGVVFEGLQGDALTEFVHRTAVQSPGFAQWCRHQHEIHLRAAAWANAAAGYYWKLGSDRQRRGVLHGIEPRISINVQRAEDAQQRIQAAIAALEEQGTLPLTVTARAKAIVQQAAVSLKTLYRYLSLWHPAQPAAELAQTCEIDQPEPDSAISVMEEENTGRSPEPLQDGEFYTWEEHMKSVSTETGCSPAPSFPPTRRPPTSEILQMSLPLESLYVASPSFAEPPAVPERFQVEASCVQAMLRGDRAWVLRRLMSLWAEGHEALVRLLCRLHPVWGVEVRQSGPVEVGTHAP